MIELHAQGDDGSAVLVGFYPSEAAALAWIAKLRRKSPGMLAATFVTVENGARKTIHPPEIDPEGDTDPRFRPEPS